MSKQDLDGLVRFASSFARIVFETQGEFLPVWHMVRSDGQHTVLPPPPTDDKDEAIAMIRAYMLENDVVRYVFTTEAWMIRRNSPITDEEVNRMMEAGVSNHPDAVEVIQILAEDEECGQITAHYQISRSENGKPTLGKLVMDPPMLNLDGRMVGLLPRRGTLQ